MIRTQSGEKGPFDADQIRRFVDAGKVPRSHTVYSADSGLAIPVEDVIGADAEVEEPVDDDFDLYEEDTHDDDPGYAQPNVPTSAPQRAAPQRGASQQRATGAARGRTPTRGSRRGPSPSRGGSVSAGTGFYRAKKSPLPMLVIVLVIVGLCGAAGWVWYSQRDSGVVGVWLVDVEATKSVLNRQLEINGERAGMSEREIEEKRERVVASLLLASSVKMSLRADGTASFAGMPGVHDTSEAYEAKPLGGGLYVIVTNSGGVEQSLRVKIEGDSMHWLGESGASVFVFKRSK